MISLVSKVARTQESHLLCFEGCRGKERPRERGLAYSLHCGWFDGLSKAWCLWTGCYWSLGYEPDNTEPSAVSKSQLAGGSMWLSSEEHRSCPACHIPRHVLARAGVWPLLLISEWFLRLTAKSSLIHGALWLLCLYYVLLPGISAVPDQLKPPCTD